MNITAEYKAGGGKNVFFTIRHNYTIYHHYIINRDRFSYKLTSS